MNIEDYKIVSGLNAHQTASLERNEKTIDYNSNKHLTYIDILNLSKGLNVVSEFFDVNAVVTVSGTNVCAVALGKSVEEAMTQAMDINPIAFINAYVIVSAEVDSDIVKTLKQSNIIAAPKFTQNAIKYMEEHDICYVAIETPLKEYKKYLSNETIVTPLGTLTQTPNLSDLNKDTFKIMSKAKPTVEQIEDAVFAWKVAKNIHSHAIVIAKDLKTSSISQGLNLDSVEYALNQACELSKDAILASDMPLNLHDINAAAQCRIGLIIVPLASVEIINAAEKFGMLVITTGITNITY